MINEKIVLVTDSNTKRTEASISDRNLEGNNSIATQKISNAIKNSAILKKYILPIYVPCQ